MNSERMKHVRDFIASLPTNACDMTSWYEIAFVDESDDRVTFALMKEQGFACGSAACIAGWAAMLADQKTPYEVNANADYIPSYYADHRATAYLELTNDEANRLFTEFPDSAPVEGWKDWMVARLDDCIEAGYVTSWHNEEEEYVTMAMESPKSPKTKSSPIKGESHDEAETV